MGILSRVKSSPSLAGLVTGSVIVLLVLLTSSPKIESNADRKMTDATVMITNLAGNSGGTGVVVSVSDNESEILTNSHVCGLLKSGGKITTTYGESHLAKLYKQDVDHDLCLVVIAAKLKAKAKIASSKPEMFTDATISGHPNLLPNVLSRGYFSDSRVIQVFTGITPCSEEQMHDRTLGVVCMFFGGLPVIKSYETIVVTALIMPGSSGSAVYNESQEVSGLVFAGSAGMSYAFIVPYDYVKSFLNKNLNGKNRETFNLPDYKLDIEKLLAGDQNNKRNLIKKCTSIKLDKLIDDTCKIVVDTINWMP